MKTLLIVVGAMLAIYGSHLVIFSNKTTEGLLFALLAIGLFIATSDQVWKEEK